MTHAATYAQILGHVIHGHRELRGVSLDTMAKEMGFSTRSGWSRVESGETTITAAQLRKAARCLGRPPWALVQDADNLAAQLESAGVKVLDEKPDDKPTGKKPWLTAAILTVVAAGTAGAVVAAKKNQRDDEK